MIKITLNHLQIIVHQKLEGLQGVAQNVTEMCKKHLDVKNGKQISSLLRLFAVGGRLNDW